jgi:hypothetical protein
MNLTKKTYTPRRGEVPQLASQQAESWGSEHEWGLMDGTRDRVHLSVSRYPGAPDNSCRKSVTLPKPPDLCCRAQV